MFFLPWRTAPYGKTDLTSAGTSCCFSFISAGRAPLDFFNCPISTTARLKARDYMSGFCFFVLGFCFFYHQFNDVSAQKIHSINRGRCCNSFRRLPVKTFKKNNNFWLHVILCQCHCKGFDSVVTLIIQENILLGICTQSTSVNGTEMWHSGTKWLMWRVYWDLKCSHLASSHKWLAIS